MAIRNLASPIRRIKNQSIISHFSEGIKIDFQRGETIINGFDEPKGVFLIQKGFVKAYSISEAGHENLFLMYGEDEFIPLPWALDGENPDGLLYKAVTKTTVIRASRDRLRIAMGNNSWLAQEILKQTVNTLSVYTKRIQTLELRTAKSKLVAELLFLTSRFGKLRGKGILIDAPITHQDIADSINMSRETASKALEILFQEKLIHQNGRFFTVPNLANLQSKTLI